MIMNSTNSTIINNTNTNPTTTTTITTTTTTTSINTASICMLKPVSHVRPISSPSHRPSGQTDSLVIFTCKFIEKFS
ncbi:unnamed protein product [Nesidiocoris tenuis]|uniref:Uncharacterized protein n=1 Tax=Nesidiocoris tenuis TaxID=355587 RepID=A0A6H5HD39_9HEMI|nr:unnamed protein product [Nesidiocoris tenuis]